MVHVSHVYMTNGKKRKNKTSFDYIQTFVATLKKKKKKLVQLLLLTYLTQFIKVSPFHHVIIIKVINEIFYSVNISY